MIIKANLNDVVELNRLVNSAYRGESSKQGWTTEAHILGGIRTTEKGLIETINNLDTIILKYANNKKIVGCMTLVDKGNKLYLGMLTVKPNLQGRGVGKKLLCEAERIAKGKKISKICMTVISVRVELIAWYKRHGYIDIGERKPFPMDDPNFGIPKQFLEFIVLEKTIL